MRLCLCLGHHLDAEAPLREVTFFDRGEQIALMRFAIAGNNFGRFFVSDIPDALLGLKVKLHPRRARPEAFTIE